MKHSPVDALIVGKQDPKWLTDAAFSHFVGRFNMHSMYHLENRNKNKLHTLKITVINYFIIYHIYYI